MKILICLSFFVSSYAVAKSKLTSEQQILSKSQGIYELKAPSDGTTKGPAKKSCLSGVLEYNPQEQNLLLDGAPLAIRIKPADSPLTEFSESCDEIAEAVMTGQKLTYIYSFCDETRKPVQVTRTVIFQDNKMKSYVQTTHRGGKKTEVSCYFDKLPSKGNGGGWVIRSTSSDSEPTLVEIPAEESQEKILDPAGL